MASFAVKAHILHSRSHHRIEIFENSFLVVEDGSCAGVFRTLPPAFEGIAVEDFGDRLLIPGMNDLHIHAPQFAYRGLGMDMELLDWLNTYAFPEEAKFRDLSYAGKSYDIFVSHLRRSFTTRAAVFATIHPEATLLLMKKLEDSGLRTFVGKVNMDRQSPDYLREHSADEAVRDTERWIEESLSAFQNTRPILTPRFIPSCSDQLLAGLQKLGSRYDLPTQSHLSENLNEIALVAKLCPDTRFYGEAYDRFGLFGGERPCIMAHCVHSGEEELALMRRNRVYIAHSPESNMNLASGVAPVSRYLELGLNTGLATDVAGGSHESMLRAVAHALQASRLRWRLQDQSVKPLTVDQAFYLATAGGGGFFGKVGRFDPGYEFDALVLDDAELEHPQPLSVRARLERFLFLGDERHIRAKYVAGKRLF